MIGRAATMTLMALAVSACATDRGSTRYVHPYGYYDYGFRYSIYDHHHYHPRPDRPHYRPERPRPPVVVRPDRPRPPMVVRPNRPVTLPARVPRGGRLPR
jgi:hypothetical protein